MRFLSAQFLTCMEHGRWLDFAGNANQMAASLQAGGCPF